MNMLSKKSSQFELFPRSQNSQGEGGRHCYQFKNLTLSLENIIVICILLLMLFILFFSFGVERGKKIALLSMPQKRVENIDQFYKTNLQEDISSDITRKVKVQIPIETIENKTEQKIEKNKTIERDLLEEEVISQDSFTIQVASFKLEKNAKKEAMNLKEKGYDIFVLPKGKHSIVCVGKFAKKSEAKELSKELKNRYGDCLIRRL